jgi:hypothetical protein
METVEATSADVTSVVLEARSLALRQLLRDVLSERRGETVTARELLDFFPRRVRDAMGRDVTARELGLALRAAGAIARFYAGRAHWLAPAPEPQPRAEASA